MRSAIPAFVHLLEGLVKSIRVQTVEALRVRFALLGRASGRRYAIKGSEGTEVVQNKVHVRLLL